MKFADRGLVTGGYPNLGLSETLSFVTYIFFVTCLYGIFPLSHQIRNNFPADSRKGQLCMQLDFAANENYTKHRIKQAIFPFLVMVFVCMMRRNMRRSVKDQNLRCHHWLSMEGSTTETFSLQPKTLVMCWSVFSLLLQKMDS